MRAQIDSGRFAGTFWFGLCALWLCSATLHALAWPDAPRLTPDGKSYMEAARDLKDLHIDALHDRPPGYPLLVAASGSAESPSRTLVVLQLLLHFVSTLLLTAVCLSLGVRRPLVLAFALLASLPPSVAPAAYLLSETASEFTLALTIGSFLLWLCGRHWWWLVTAILASATAGFVRPSYFVLGECLALAVFIFARLWRGSVKSLTYAAVGLAVVPAVALAAFITFNHQRFGFTGVTPLLGFNLCTKTIGVVERLSDTHATFRDILLSHRDRSLVEPHSDHTGAMSIWVAIPDLQAASSLSRPELSQKMLALNLLLVRSAPLNYISQFLRAMGSYWTPTPSEAANFGSRGLQLVWVLVLTGTLLLFGCVVLTAGGLLCLALVLPGLRSAGIGPHRPLALGVLLTFTTIFYSMLVSAAVETGDPRYRTPTDLLIWFSTLLGFTLLERLRAGPLGSGRPAS